MNLPVTRYYGSKRRLLDKIWEALAVNQIEFNSVLDLFGGTMNWERVVMMCE